MKLEDLLNEDLTDAEVKREIKVIISDKKYAKDTDSSGVKHHPFGKHKVINGKVEHLSDTLYINSTMVDIHGVLRVPFRSAKSVSVISWKLCSFINFPEVITGPGFYGLDYCGNTSGGNHINSWEGFPKNISGNVQLTSKKYEKLSYSKFNTICQRINGDIGIQPKYEGPLLSMLLVKDLERVGTTFQASKAQWNAANIITAHLKSGRDIIDCKEELMNAGYKEYAKL
jgi:hypothetical protein